MGDGLFEIGALVLTVVAAIVGVVVFGIPRSKFETPRNTPEPDVKPSRDHGQAVVKRHEHARADIIQASTTTSEQSEATGGDTIADKWNQRR